MLPTMSGPFIRPYDSTKDFEPCLHIFFTTMDESLQFEPARTIGSYIWCKSYLSLSPNTCFVLDDGSGLAVGYIIGTSNTRDFAERWEEVLIPIIDPKLVPKPDATTQESDESPLVKDLKIALYSAHCSDIVDRHDLLEKYPAHLHIDILPEFQRKGFGNKMIETFLGAMKESGASGVHLGMMRTNEGGKKFYEKLGFVLCDEVLDSGLSGEVGRKGDSLVLVKKI